jgi:hypothetical protein
MELNIFIDRNTIFDFTLIKTINEVTKISWMILNHKQHQLKNWETHIKNKQNLGYKVKDRIIK